MISGSEFYVVLTSPRRSSSKNGVYAPVGVMVYLLGSVVFYLPTTKVAHNLADLITLQI